MMSRTEQKKITLTKKMNFEEDERLLALAETEVQSLQDRLARAEQELQERYRIIRDQADLIKRYRAVVKGCVKAPSSLPLVPEISKPEKRKETLAKKRGRVLKKARGKQGEFQVKFPTQDDTTYGETAIGQAIWGTILGCFRNSPRRDLVTDRMIMTEAGRNVLYPEREAFFTTEMIDRYFSHPFEIGPDTRTITVRHSQQQSWEVIRPDWLEPK